MKRAVGYIRVSSREQGQSGFGLASQKAEIEGFARAARYRIVHVYCEVASAVGGSSVEKREVLREALAHAREKGWPLIISRLDRLSRDANEIETLVLGSDVEIVCARTDADSRYVKVSTEAAVIQKETEMRQERTRAGVARARARGVTFGNKVNLPEAGSRGVETNRKLAQIRRKELEPIIAQLRAKGATTGVEIARLLNARDLRTYRGQPWTGANIRRVLRDMDQAARDQSLVDVENRANPAFGSW
jgi:DNA invertase Pin-like site-specific DNA recombinase